MNSNFQTTKILDMPITVISQCNLARTVAWMDASLSRSLCMSHLKTLTAHSTLFPVAPVWCQCSQGNDRWTVLCGVDLLLVCALQRYTCCGWCCCCCCRCRQVWWPLCLPPRCNGDCIYALACCLQSWLSTTALFLSLILRLQASLVACLPPSLMLWCLDYSV